MGSKYFNTGGPVAWMPLVVTALMVVLVLATGFVWADKTVYVAVDGQTIKLRTLSNDPEQILAQADVRLGPQDEYRISGGKITRDAVISVYRAVPVTVTYQGQTTALTSGKPTVGELVASLGFDLDGVKLTPGPDSRLRPNMGITVVGVSRRVVERDEPIVRDVIRRADSELELGEQQVLQEGSDGLGHVRVEQTYEDGRLASERVLDQQVITPAVPTIVLIGSNDTVQTSRGTERFRQVMTMKATAYLPGDGDGWGITATGVPAAYGVVAVDPSVIPLGTRLYIPGYGYALAADTGGAIRGNRIDLCMEDYSQAVQFGRRTVKVYILN